MALTVEGCLHELEEKAALLRYLAYNAADTDEPPYATVLPGIGDVCDEIESIARAVRSALRRDALLVKVRQDRP